MAKSKCSYLAFVSLLCQECARVLPRLQGLTCIANTCRRLSSALARPESLLSSLRHKVHVHRITTDLWHPWVLGFDRNLFVRDFWKYLDIDAAMQARGGR